MTTPAPVSNLENSIIEGRGANNIQNAPVENESGRIATVIAKGKMLFEYSLLILCVIDKTLYVSVRNFTVPRLRQSR